MAPLGTPLEGLSIVIAGTFPGTNHGKSSLFKTTSISIET